MFPCYPFNRKFYFIGFFANLLSDYRIMGDALAAGAKATIAVAPKSVIIFMRFSPEQKKGPGNLLLRVPCLLHLLRVDSNTDIDFLQVRVCEPLVIYLEIECVRPGEFG